MKQIFCYVLPFACCLALTIRADGIPPMFTSSLQQDSASDWWAADIRDRIEAAGDNRSQLESALRKAPDAHREALCFLIRNMPKGDLLTLDCHFLLDHIDLAIQARHDAPWEISDRLFLNYVLPYSNIDEPRESWRQSMIEICRPLVSDCKTPTEAAQRLNEKLFAKVGVKYSTRRKRANQAPSESIQQGLASCTGLSILLVDACRSVGVPARLAGIPSWPNKRGNHTWVEVWDQDWHFTGAAEYDSKGLNRTWFQRDASLAVKDSRMNAIYAVSFERTQTTFPMVWSRDPENSVYAINVTDRYTSDTTPTETGKVRVSIRAWQPERRDRQALSVKLVCRDCNESHKGVTKAGTADMNDMLSFALRPNADYVIQYQWNGMDLTQSLRTDDHNEQIVEIELPASSDPDGSESEISNRPPDFDQQVRSYFAVDPPGTENHFSEDVLAYYRQHPEECRQTVWQLYKESEWATMCRSDFEQGRVRFREHVSPYTVREVGQRPKNGWPLFIAMHGGGGAPARVNDSQWKIMQRYYHDQADVAGYKYLALRAPNNTWNGFYDNYVYPLIENLIHQFVVLGDVDPDRVFIMGYSHGGYGAFAIGPKIPHRFAAIHSSAAAPTDGESSAVNLRNTRFTFMVGERDNAYGRRERCEKFNQQIEALRGESGDIYPVQFLYQPGFGHGGLPDRDMIADMYPYKRNALPRHLTWELTDPVVDDFFWISVKRPSKGQSIEARLEDNQLQLDLQNRDQVTVWLDSRLIDPDRSVQISYSGKTQSVIYQPDLECLCESVCRSGDIQLAFDFRVDVSGGEQ